MKGTTDMSSKNSAKTTAADLVDQAVEEKLVVPAQAEGEAKVEETGNAAETTETPELKVIEGGKKSLKERLSEVTGHLKKNQKALIAVGAAASVAALAFAKYAKKKAEETLELEQVEPELIEDTETEAVAPADETAA
jgi:coenzyme F420-reducing hydrogenase gamma subunit